MSDREVIRLPDLAPIEARIELPDVDDSPGEAPDCIRLPDMAGDDEEAVANVVAAGQRFVLKHPSAAQALYRALVAEGRRFAGSEDGHAWRARLEASPAIRRLRPLWEAATFNVLDATGESALPSKLVELVAQAVSHADIEATTAFLSERSTGAFGEPRRR